MIYRQKRKTSHSSKQPQRAHEDYRPDVMTLHSLGVSATSNPANYNSRQSSYSQTSPHGAAKKTQRRSSQVNQSHYARDPFHQKHGASSDGGWQTTRPHKSQRSNRSGQPLQNNTGLTYPMDHVRYDASLSTRPGYNSRSEFIDDNFGNTINVEKRRSLPKKKLNQVSTDSSPKLKEADSSESRFLRQRRTPTRAGHAFRRSYIRRDPNKVTGSFESSAPTQETSSDSSPNFQNASFLPDPNSPQRLHKVLANVGIGSRRKMEQLILDGSVVVNNKPAEIGQKVFPGDTVIVCGERIKVTPSQGLPRILLYNKPDGQMVSRSDPEGRPLVFDFLPELEEGAWISVGRLDFNTSGLLLFTTSGDLANHLMHPSQGLEREYAVRINRILSEEQIHILETGVMLDDGPAHFRCVTSAYPEKESNDSYNHWYRVVLSEGRNREVRRMFESLGIQVTRLIRIRYGDVSLPVNLRRGSCQEMSDQQVQAFIQKLEARLLPQADKKRQPGARAPIRRRRLMKRG